MQSIARGGKLPGGHLRHAIHAIFCLIVLGCNPTTKPKPPEHESNTRQIPAFAVAPAQNSTRIVFGDQSQNSGIEFHYQNDGDHSNFAILESLGGGVGIFDFDADGRLDVFLPGGGLFEARQTKGLSSALFRNIAGWRFVNVTGPSNIGFAPHYSHGAAIADFDNDGFDDVLLTGYGGVVLYSNQGDGTFIDVTDNAGLNDHLWSSSAAWGDFNGDGSLDVFIAHYVDWSSENDPFCHGPPGHPQEVCPPRQFQGLPDILYFGNHDGTFRDGSDGAGLQPGGKGLGAVAADLDLDGDLDLYITNDTVPNFLYRNNGNGVFDEVGQISGTALSDIGTPDGSMGTDVGDYNGDGLPDIWVSNYERENNAIYRNLGKGQFRHVSQAAGISAVGAVYVGWGTRFIDADLDGDEDLVVANGHVIRFPLNTPRLQTPLMLENTEGKRFINVAEQAGPYFRTTHGGRGLATGDLDDDGDEDLVISNLNEPVAILSNDTSTGNNWLAIRIIGRSSVRNSIGAIATAKIGTRTLTRFVRGGSSFASTSDYKLHFGCGTSGQVDELTIKWISGSQTLLKNVRCNQVLQIIEE